MSFAAPNRRLYVGRIAQDANRLDLEDHFSTLGPRPVDVKILNGYGFIEFNSVAEAEDAKHEFDNKEFMGDRLLVQFAKASAERPPRRFDDRDSYRGSGGRDGGFRGSGRERDSYGRGGADRGGSRPQGWRIQITNLPPGCSWQDLKDFARTAGNVNYSEVSRSEPSEGIIEYMSFTDAETALKTLDGVDMRGSVVRLAEHSAPPGQTWTSPRASPPRRERDDDRDRRGDSRRDSRRERSRSRSPRRSDRDRDDRDRRSGGGGGRDRDEDDRRGSSRRDRSRSRSRSPPRRRAESRERSPRY